MKNEWMMVSFSADCEDDCCSICGEDYSECDCPGPTMDEYEYKFDEGGVMWARLKEDDAAQSN